jgi:hypothetical protein
MTPTYCPFCGPVPLASNPQTIEACDEAKKIFPVIAFECANSHIFLVSATDVDSSHEESTSAHGSR